MFSLLTLLGAFKVHLILTNSLSNIKIQLVSSNFGMGLLCDVTPSYIIQRSHYVSLSWKQNFLYLNKLWSCKYGRKTKKLTCMTFLYIWFVRQYKWLSLERLLRSRKSCYHGNLTSHFSSCRKLREAFNAFSCPQITSSPGTRLPPRAWRFF